VATWSEKGGAGEERSPLPEMLAEREGREEEQDRRLRMGEDTGHGKGSMSEVGEAKL
jgi:hypothetical protein